MSFCRCSNTYITALNNGLAAFILDNANILVATANGKTIRIDSENIAHSGRHTTGTKLINLDKDDFVVAVTCLPEEQVEEIENE